MHDEFLRLADDLENGHERTIVEIVRLGEKFLDSQLTSGIAADQRATTFASILTLATATLIGGYITIEARGYASIKISLFVSVVCIFFMISIILSIAASRSTKWGYAGNNPSKWRNDVKDNKTMKRALSEQLELYSQCIYMNNCILSTNSRLMMISYISSLIGVLSGGVVAMYTP
ncbi:MAG: hypothetical protein H6878_10165 [Rhodobiaceae bacterium]|nr:hypothetical protein [Rhodobiaceae bacterium]MCC0016626.1 hypothetical protein [Rhodobiaceae bacterium]